MNLRYEFHLFNDDRPIFQFDAPEHEGYIIGRSDEGNEFVPDIDLATYNARAAGISRRRAALVRYRGLMHVLDLNSVNGTFLNNKRMLPEVPYPLNSGDELRLGSLRLILFQAALIR